MSLRDTSIQNLKWRLAFVEKHISKLGPAPSNRQAYWRQRRHVLLRELARRQG